MSTINLTNSQIQSIKNDMDNNIEMLTQQEIEYIATKINNEVNIPFMGESREQTVIVKIVKRMDRTRNI